MPNLQVTKGCRHVRARPAAVLGILVGVLFGSAACTTSGQAAVAADPPTSSTTSPPPVVVLRNTRDIAGEPIPFGAASYFGAVARADLSSGVVGIAASASGGGYLVVTGDGKVLSFGDARFHGSVPARDKENAAAIVVSENGAGYWLACSNGRVFNFGDAGFHGSAAALQLTTPIVAMAATPGGRGYWLAASGGRVLHYGQARFYGSAITQLHGDHIVAMAETPDGRGYWLAASDGRVFSYGDAHPYGAAARELHNDHIVALAATPGGRGYWLVSAGGQVFRYGDAEYYGSASPAVRTDPIVAAAPTPDGKGYWLLPSVPASVGLPAPGNGFVAGHITAIGDSVMLDAQPALEADIKGIDVEAAVSRQWDTGIALAQQLKSEGRLGAIVVIDLGTNGPVSLQQFADLMSVLSGASRVVFVTVHLPSSYSWATSVNATLEQGVARYPRARLADFNKLANQNPQWFYSDGVHMPIGGTGALAMAGVVKSEI